MEAKIINAALIAGLIVGCIMIGIALYVYVKDKKFGLGGSVLTVFGVMLIGLSIWKTVEISVSPEGGVEAKFHALERRVKEVQEKADSTTKKVQKIEQHQKASIKRIRKDIDISLSQIRTMIETMQYPEMIAPEGPKGIVPEGPKGIVPEGPKGIVPEGPKGIVPEGPKGIVPEGPKGIVPEGPKGIVPEGPKGTPSLE